MAMEMENTLQQTSYDFRYSASKLTQLTFDSVSIWDFHGLLNCTKSTLSAVAINHWQTRVEWSERNPTRFSKGKTKIQRICSLSFCDSTGQPRDQHSAKIRLRFPMPLSTMKQLLANRLLVGLAPDNYWSTIVCKRSSDQQRSICLESRLHSNSLQVFWMFRTS